MSTANNTTETTTSTEDTAATHKAQRQAERRAEREAAIAAAPFAAVTVLANGIHPATSRMVGIHIATFTDTGELVDEYYQVFNPGENPGPRHLHSLTAEDVAKGARFETQLRTICTLLDGRTLITHNSTRDWGFIVSESRRAIRVLNSKNPRRQQRRRGQKGRRRRVGHIPRPKLVVDTLESARRRHTNLPDTRVRAVARTLGMQATSPKASVARATLPAEQLARENTLLVARMFFTHLRECVVAAPPTQLRGDRFGLQRSKVRIDAATAARPHTNPGVYVPGGQLVQGMEMVLTPDISTDPDTLITAAVDAGVAYSEKLTRETSIVVCNEQSELRGKAMHARRKGIPLVSDTEFLKLIRNVATRTAG